jgi:hypothetical protein
MLKHNPACQPGIGMTQLQSPWAGTGCHSPMRQTVVIVVQSKHGQFERKNVISGHKKTQPWLGVKYVVFRKIFRQTAPTDGRAIQ